MIQPDAYENKKYRAAYGYFARRPVRSRRSRIVIVGAVGMAAYLLIHVAARIAIL
jgi:hypothetical protein